MSYKEASPGCWTKPVGYHLFTFREDSNAWENWFVNGMGETDLYQRKELNEKDADETIPFLKHAEAYTRINIAASTGSQFEGKGWAGLL